MNYEPVVLRLMNAGVDAAVTRYLTLILIGCADVRFWFFLRDDHVAQSRFISGSMEHLLVAIMFCSSSPEFYLHIMQTILYTFLRDLTILINLNRPCTP